MNGFNNYFTNVGRNLARNIKSTSLSFADFMSHPSSNTFFLEPTTEFEILGLTKGLDVKKASGYDNLPAKLIVIAADYISKPLCYIFNLSFTQCMFPKCS